MNVMAGIDAKEQILLAARAARPLAVLPTWDSLCAAAPLLCTRSFIKLVRTEALENQTRAARWKTVKEAFSLCEKLIQI